MITSAKSACMQRSITCLGVASVQVQVCVCVRVCARAFGCLKRAVFNNSLLSKRAVYQAVVVPVLMYGAETWTSKAEHIRHLTVFHNRCVRTILGVTRFEQW